MVEKRYEELRRRPDMCGAFAVESVAAALLRNIKFRAPLWVFDSRLDYLQRDYTPESAKLPNNILECSWVRGTLERLREEYKIPYSAADLRIVSDTRELLAATSKGVEIIIIGLSSDYRVPDMYHLGHYIVDRYGRRFQSMQQATHLADLTDYFRRLQSCNAIFIH